MEMPMKLINIRMDEDLKKNHLNQKKLTKCSENEYNASKLERLSFFIKYRIN